ncbi:Ankyrin-3 [Paramyrothecium foliicola]|nr:Ankyrin-3 [Paramyrothecium foliicola]
MTFGYNAALMKNFSALGIRDHARGLLTLLRDKRDNEDAASRPIVFVSHSLGGIVVKQVFLGTPHRGSDVAFWGDMLARVASVAFLRPVRGLIKDLRNNSGLLMDVSEDFRSIANEYKIVSFYEADKVPRLNSVVVAKYSAVLELPLNEEASPLGGDHSEICKFSGEEDARFETVWKAIKRVATPPPLKRIGKYPPKTEFFGRSNEIQELCQTLNTGTPGRKGVVVSGFSGYGKTQLALHYVNNYWPTSSMAFWIDASSVESIDNAFDEIAAELQGSHSRHKASVSDFKRWLCQDSNKSWLVVFDSVEDHDNLDIRNYFPSCEQGSIIITTVLSCIHTPLGFHGLSLEGVNEEAGADRLCIDLLSSILYSNPLSAEKAAKHISRKLRGIPLAIEQAGAFSSLGMVEIQNFSAHFQEKYLRVAYTTLPLHAPLPNEYHNSERDEARASAGNRSVLTLPFWLIELRKHPRDFGLALQKLEQLSLIKVNRQESQIRSFSIHEMVRGWMLDKVPEGEIPEYIITAFALIGTILIPKDTLQVPGGKFASLYGSGAAGFGKFCAMHGRLETSKDLLTASLEYRTMSGKCNNRAHLAQLEELAELDWRSGDLEVAIGRYEALLEKCNQILGEDDATTLEVAAALRNIRDRDAVRNRDAQRASRAAIGPKREHNFHSHSFHTKKASHQDMDDEEWKLVASYNESSYQLGEDDMETQNRAQDLNRKGETALHRSVLHNDAKITDLLLQQGIDTSVTADASTTALHLATDQGATKIIQMLVNSGANINAKDSRGWTALHVAINRKVDEIVGLLIDGGADIDATTLDRATPFHFAAINGFEDITKAILHAGADINTMNFFKMTALHHATVRGSYDSVIKLLQEGADLSVKTNGGLNTLHMAASKGFESIAISLIEAGAEIDAKTKEGWTAFHFAAFEGFEGITISLIQAGADVNARPERGWTALQLLSEVGAAVNAQGHDYLSGRGLAPDLTKYRHIRQILFDAGADTAEIIHRNSIIAKEQPSLGQVVSSEALRQVRVSRSTGERKLTRLWHSVKKRL